ncbi:response regulator transcription factor [Lignipirellula cremea]|uniref:Response regulator protein TodT n=1 Tax=Lignipirellula cremea TaxID=2528010 RepID=A0A518DT03_9BACT|nr:LuxR C-terminal-related transcriptional regulator [Lignipirellula cremea]QDU94954.1 Response regulator protein TodT [Lignipirellula cremea]
MHFAGDQGAAAPTVVVVDSDPEIRGGFVDCLRNQGIAAQTHSTPGEALANCTPHMHGCLLTEWRLPGMSGLDLQQSMAEHGCSLPFIVISREAKPATVVRAMQHGALDFFQKPCCHMQLLDSVDKAIKQDAQERRLRAMQEQVRQRLRLLTPREREVLFLVVEGRLTKQISRRLGISHKTVEVHRSNITRKMQADSVSQLLLMLTRCSIPEFVVELNETGDFVFA